jgi:hypothetical protein
MLGADPTVTFTSITKNDGSDANCPDLTVDVLNSNDGEGGEGGEGDDCEPTINAEACELVFDCPADGLTGTVGITNDGFSGTITVVVGEVSCAYTLGGTIE